MSLASNYAKRNCSQCTGKGWFERDLGTKESIEQHICSCVEKNLHKEVSKL